MKPEYAWTLFSSMRCVPAKTGMGMLNRHHGVSIVGFMGDKKKTGLLLTGGGARAAYQVGVLQGVSAILGEAGWTR